MNFFRSHESNIHGDRPRQLEHNAQEMILPPYHPDTDEIRKDWAWYYDKVTQMDSSVGQVIQTLKENDLYDETIIFYYSDHGGVLARSKRYLYDSGQLVPFIVRVPEKYQNLYPDFKPGTKNDRLISFVDLAPTMLSLIGIESKDHHDGVAFNTLKNKRNFVYGYSSRFDEKIDMSRSVRDKDFLLIRHFMPELPFGDNNEYQFRQATMDSWKNAFENGECNEVQSAFWKPKPAVELFDCSTDPHNILNLADSEEYHAKRKELDNQLKKWMIEERDKGVVHELERRSLDEILAIDQWTTEVYKALLDFVISVADNTVSKEDILTALNKNKHYQYWALHFINKNKIDLTNSELNKVSSLLEANAISVQIQAAILLFSKRKDRLAEQKIMQLLSKKDMIQLYTLDALDGLSADYQKIFISSIQEIASLKPKKRYNAKRANALMRKWE